MPKLKIVLLAAFTLLVLSGPLQHIGAIPQTTVGDASKAVLKPIKDALFPPAFAACGTGEGFAGVGGGGTNFSGTLPSGIGGGGFGNGGTAVAGLSGGSRNGGGTAIPPSQGAGNGASSTNVAGSGAAGGGASGNGADSPVLAGTAGTGATPGAGQGGSGPVGGASFGGGAGGGSAIGAGGAAGGGSSPGMTIEFMVVSPGMGPAPFREREQLKPRALLVDAHEDQRESNRVLLQLDGYAVMTAADAQQGLESFDWFLPNVVLVDRDLPGNQVAEFARKVRQAKVGSSAVLVALSAQAEQERRDVLAAGFDGVLAKPLKLKDLREVIELLARRSARTQTAANEQDQPARLTLSTAGRSSYAVRGPAASR